MTQSAPWALASSSSSCWAWPQSSVRRLLQHEWYGQALLRLHCITSMATGRTFWHHRRVAVAGGELAQCSSFSIALARTLRSHRQPENKCSIEVSNQCYCLCSLDQQGVESHSERFLQHISHDTRPIQSAAGLLSCSARDDVKCSVAQR